MGFKFRGFFHWRPRGITSTYYHALSVTILFVPWRLAELGTSSVTPQVRLRLAQPRPPAFESSSAFPFRLPFSQLHHNSRCYYCSLPSLSSRTGYCCRVQVWGRSRLRMFIYDTRKKCVDVPGLTSSHARVIAKQRDPTKPT